jgi:hypothetical protein
VSPGLADENLSKLKIIDAVEDADLNCMILAADATRIDDADGQIAAEILKLILVETAASPALVVTEAIVDIEEDWLGGANQQQLRQPALVVSDRVAERLRTSRVICREQDLDEMLAVSIDVLMIFSGIACVNGMTARVQQLGGGSPFCRFSSGRSESPF